MKGGKSNGFPSPFLSSELYGGMAYHNGEDSGISVSPGVPRPFNAFWIIFVRLVAMWIAVRTTWFCKIGFEWPSFNGRFEIEAKYARRSSGRTLMACSASNPSATDCRVIPGLPTRNPV